MRFSAEGIPYRQTGSFSKIVLDYLDDAATLRPLYNYRPDIDGIKKAIAARKDFPVNRQLLVNILQKQYANIEISDKLKANINALLSENTFTVCTAHQPNIFTGHLYFIYKILHAVKLSDELNEKIPGKKFIPVYYMGSEDADLDELGEVHVYGTEYRWQTKQTGAVGRMKIDKAFIQLLDAIDGRLSVEPHGPAVIAAIRDCYREGRTIEEATFDLVHRLFGEFGLLIILPDSRELKAEFTGIVSKELKENFSHKAVDRAMAVFPAEYKVQAAGRDINLFYLENDSRERIEKEGEEFVLADSKRVFSEAELESELKTHPEKFSPNVILRPVFQEMILPDIVFIGGGAEIAYWLELKNVFEEAKAFFPVLMLRNSFALINKKTSDLLHQHSFTTKDIFRSERSLLEEIVARNSDKKLDIDNIKQDVQNAYDALKNKAGAVDPTLAKHAEALHTQAAQRLDAMEKKMLRKEKLKFEAEQRHISKIKSSLYPGDVLQERTENILQYLAAYNHAFIHMLYEHSPAIEPSFTVITEA